MRAKTTTLLSMTALFAVAIAHALPPGEREAKKIIRPPAAHAHRMGQTVTKNGQTLTRKQILEKFDATEELDLGGGKKITAQEMMDRIDKAEVEVSKRGSSLANLKVDGWHKPTTLTKLTAQKAAVATEVQSHNSARANLLAGVSPMGCHPDNCSPRDKEKTIKFEKEKGDDDTVAVYTTFGITEKTPNANEASCTATWDNGVKLMGDKHSLIKFTVDAAGTKKPNVTASAKGALYVLGQSSPLWSKSGSVTSESLDRTFKTPKAKMTVELIPLINVEGSMMAAATLGLRPSFSGTSDAKSVTCNVGIAPRLTANVDADASISVGIPHIVDLVKGGVRGQLTVVDVSMPTTLGVRMTEAPMGLNLTLKSEVKSSFLKGKVEAYFTIQDICHWGFCLISDGLGIPTSGSVKLWQEDNGFVYNVTLADINNGSVPFQTPQPTMSMGPGGPGVH